MSMEIITWPDPPAYARIQQLVADELADVGIELIPSIPDDSYELFIGGDFDIALWDEGYGDDPTWLLSGYYASSSIPGKEGEGLWNAMRFSNEEFDTLLAQARATADPEERLALLCQMDRLLTNELPTVALVVMPFPDVYSARLQGWKFNPNDIMTWNIADWWIRE
jgi:ABC-type transport system substrate-binding protein